MAKANGSTGSVKLSVLACILFTCLFGQILNVSGLNQELWLYFDKDHQGDHRWFQSNQPNLTSYSELLPLVKSVCATGVWSIYREENFKNQMVTLGSFETASEVPVCEQINGSKIQSLRLTGSSDTEDIGLDLFTKNGYKGEIYSSYGEDGLLWGVDRKVRSLAATGYDTSFLLFEEESLRGNYTCLPVPKAGYQFAWVDDIQSELGLSTVRSTIGGRFCPNGVSVDDLDSQVEELRQKYKLE